MRREINIPNEVRASIASHFRDAVKKFHQTYESTSSNEDSLTVKLGEALNTRKQRVVNVTDWQQPGKWKWKLVYTKFSDRSRDSEEKHTGADGILEFTAGGSELGRKAALFQCKKRGNRYTNTKEQAAKLSNWREAAFFIEFAQESSSAIGLDEVVRDGKISKETKRIGLAEYLIDVFLACQIGDGDIEYFADKKRLSWRDEYGKHVHASFSAKHRFRLEVFPPRKRYIKEPYGESLSFESVQLHRLDQAYEGLDLGQLKELSKIYHPDRFGQSDTVTQKTMDTRLREILERIEKLKEAAAVEETAHTQTSSLENKQSLDFSLNEEVEPNFVKKDKEE